MSHATEKIGQQIEQRTSELNSVSKASLDPGIVKNNPRIVKSIIKIVAEDMNSYTNVLKANVALLTSSRIAAMGALANALAVYEEVAGGQKSDLDEIKSQLSALHNAVQKSIHTMGDFKLSIDGIPRLLADLNRSKRALSAQIDAIIVEFASVLQTVRNILSSVDRMLSK